MSSRFLAPDLTQLTPAALIEEISFESILANQKAWVLARWEEVRVVRPDLPPLDTLGLETEPMTIVLQAYAYRETLIRALINDKARAVLLAYASGSDLDHIGAFFGVQRTTIVPATLDVAAVMESDDRLRRRIQLAPEAFSTLGPRGAYIFFALTLDPSIMDAWAYKPAAHPNDGTVNIVVTGEDAVDVADAVIARLVDRLYRDDTVPLTDAPNVMRAVRTDYVVDATLVFSRGPDPDAIKAAAEAAIRSYATKQCRIASSSYRAGLIGAAKIGSIDNVVLNSPPADVLCDDAHIPHLTDVILHTVITD